MAEIAQIMAAIVIGIVALGLLIFILRQIFTQLNVKVDKNVFSEYCKRIDDTLIAGTKKFDKIEQILERNTDILTNTCKEIVKLQEHIVSLEKQLVVKDK